MSAPVAYREDAASEAQIGEHLRECDATFTPPLSARVDIGQYAAKLRARASTFEAWAGDALVGLVAAYVDRSARSCFVSNVSVSPRFAGRGVGAELVARCLRRAREAGVERVSLEVHGGSAGAVRLYEKAGFRTLATKDGMLEMELTMGGEGQP